MATLNVDFSNVPDKLQPIPAAEYIFLVEDVTIEPIEEGKMAGKDQLTVRLKVDDPASPSNGRIVFDRMVIGTEMGDIAIKRFIKSVGLVPGVDNDTDMYKNRHCRATVKVRTYQDKQTNEQKTANNVGEYLF